MDLRAAVLVSSSEVLFRCFCKRNLAGWLLEWKTSSNYLIHTLNQMARIFFLRFSPALSEMVIPFLLISGCLEVVPSQSSASRGCGELSPALARRWAGAEGLTPTSKEGSGINHMEGSTSVSLLSLEDCSRLLGKSFCWLGSSRGDLPSFTLWL